MRKDTENFVGWIDNITDDDGGRNTYFKKIDPHLENHSALLANSKHM